MQVKLKVGLFVCRMPPTKRKAPNRGTTKKNKKSKVVKAQGNTSDKKSRNPPQYIPAAEASRSKSDEESVQNDPDMLEGSDVDDEGAKAFISGLDIKQISRYVFVTLFPRLD